MFLFIFSFYLGTNTLMILYWNERKLISSWRMNYLCTKNGVTNLTRDAFLMVCKKCSKNILKSKKITPRLNSFLSIWIKTRWVLWLGMPRGTLRTPFREVLVFFAISQFPKEYDLVFPEVPTTPRSPEKDLFSNVFLFCSKIWINESVKNNPVKNIDVFNKLNNNPILCRRSFSR